MKTNEEIRFLPLNASDPIVVIVGGMLILTLVLDPKYWAVSYTHLTLPTTERV